jgi:hypothetical protein
LKGFSVPGCVEAGLPTISFCARSSSRHKHSTQIQCVCVPPLSSPCLVLPVESHSSFIPQLMPASISSDGFQLCVSLVSRERETDRERHNKALAAPPAMGVTFFRRGVDCILSRKERWSYLSQPTNTRSVVGSQPMRGHSTAVRLLPC